MAIEKPEKPARKSRIDLGDVTPPEAHLVIAICKECLVDVRERADQKCRVRSALVVEHGRVDNGREVYLQRVRRFMVHVCH